MRWIGVLAVTGMALVASAAWGSGTRALDRCEGKPSWKYVQTLSFVEPNGSVSFDPDPAETYKLVFSGYVKDANGTSWTVLETYGHVDAFLVNGQSPPFGRFIQWHRAHPLKDPSAIEVAIQVDPSGKYLDWDIPDFLVPLPPPIPANKPCNLASNPGIPGTKLSLTPETFQANYYTGTISIAVYREVYGAGEPEPTAKVQSNITFSGSHNFSQPTPRAGERREWVSVSGSAQLSTNAEGRLQAVGGGGVAGVYVRPGPNPGDRPVAKVRRWRFRIDGVAGPPSGGDVTLNGTVTASSLNSCPAEGAAVEFLLHDGEAVNDRQDVIAVRGAGCVEDGFSNSNSYRSHAYVTVKRA